MYPFHLLILRFVPYFLGYNVPSMVNVTVRSRIIVAVNECGKRIGESHHNASIPDAVVDQIRERHEDDGWGYKRLSREFGIALTTVRKICTYERRAQTPDRWKTLRGCHG
jgi:hypothetical protein